MAKRRKLTLKELGHVDEGDRFWLCDTYANSRNDYKVVENYVIGYYFMGDGRRSPVRIAPIYRAAIWQRDGRYRRVMTTYEVGEYFNPHNADLDDYFREDMTANTVAASALLAITAVEAMADKRKTDTKKNRRGLKTKKAVKT